MQLTLRSKYLNFTLNLGPQVEEGGEWISLTSADLTPAPAPEQWVWEEEEENRHKGFGFGLA